MMFIQLRTYMVLFCQLIIAGAYSQQLNITGIPLETDNKPARILCMIKNSQGYILAGSDHGLFRFDGTRYLPVHFKNKDYADTVTALFEDRQLTIWVGFKSGRIARIDNHFLQYINPEEGTPRKKITGFIQDTSQNIWFSTAGEGVYYFRNKHLYLINEDDGLSDNHVNALAVTNNGDVIACTDQGINICSLKGNKKQVRVIGTKEGLPDYIVTSIAAAGPNQFWLGMQEKGLCLYDHITGKITTASFSENWLSGPVSSILATQNSIWIGTESMGLFRYGLINPDAGRLVSIPAGQYISGLVYDNQGNTWSSSTEKGLVRHTTESIHLRPVPGTPAFEHIHTLLADSRGFTWLNNEENEVLRLAPSHQSAEVKKYRLPGVNNKTDITSLYEDMNHNIWIGTMGKGLFILNPRTGQFRPFTENETFKQAGILSINGKNNKIYISSLEGSIAIQISSDHADIFKPCAYTTFNNRNTGTNYIYDIFEDSRGRIWFATDGNGLTVLDGNSFSYYHGKNVLQDDHVYSITEDKSGNIWFSTASAGMYKFDGTTFTNYGLKEGLSDIKISVLKTIRSGHIVIVHSNGFDILNPATGDISYVNKRQGIGEINAEDLGAVTLDQNENIMMVTDKGILTYFHPVLASQRSKTLIESVQLFLQDVDTSVHQFKYDENNFTFHFTGLYYNEPEKVIYEYKLEGLDSIWISTSDRMKNFPKLQPGHYTFRVRTGLNKNARHADEASYHFSIDKPLYKKSWFIILISLAGTSLIYWYIKNREKSVKKMERLRQEKIEHQFEVLRTQVNPHFLFNSFNTLISTIEDDPKMAVEYAGHLSDFFRDIVTYRDKDTITLQEEIALLQNYYLLQQKRYGQSLKLHIQISADQMMAYAIPPLTLQLLMENAIKHNAVSIETTLTITCDIINNETLRMINNINPRHSKQPGAGMGLQNIINRYSLLSNKKVEIIQEQNNFIVSLPLIKNI